MDLPTTASPSIEEQERKKRKPSQHPSPPWKDNDWHLTRKMLNLLLDPSNSMLRCALWVRAGETPVGGSKIEYQTKLAKMTLEGWDLWAHVEEDERWYGNRVKDWMQKLPKIYVDCEKLLREAAAAQDVDVGSWVQGGSNQDLVEAKITAKCPVYRELQLLLGSSTGMGLLPLPQISQALVFQIPETAGERDASPLASLVDPSLSNALLPLPPIAQVLERHIPGSSDRPTPRRRATDGPPPPAAPKPLSLEWMAQAQATALAAQALAGESGSYKKHGRSGSLKAGGGVGTSGDLSVTPGSNVGASTSAGAGTRNGARNGALLVPAKRDRASSLPSSSDSNPSDEENERQSPHPNRPAASLRETRKQRKLDQYHLRALRRDELEHARALALLEERDKEREERGKEREFELEKMRLGIELAKAQAGLRGLATTEGGD